MPRYQFENVYVTSYQTGGSTDAADADSFHFKDVQKGGEDGYTEVEWTYLNNGDRESGEALPAEDFTMNYEKVEWNYDEATGYTATDDLFV